MKVQKFSSFEWSWSVFIALGLAMIGIGVSMRGWSDVFDMAYLGFAAAGCAMIMVGLIYTLPSTNSLEIEDDGFSYRAGCKREFCRWEDCGPFSVYKKKVFGFDANELVVFDAKTPPKQARTNFKATGKNSVLPGTYGLDAQALADKLNKFRQDCAPAKKPVMTADSSDDYLISGRVSGLTR